MKDELVDEGRGEPACTSRSSLRALLEAGGDRHRTWTITPGAAAELPPALEALLVARIDRLDPGARRLAQIAAVVGREFPVSVAAAVAGSQEADARHRRAAARRCRPRAPAVPRARVHVPPRAVAGGRAVDPHAHVAARSVRARRRCDGRAPRRRGRGAARAARVLLLPERRAGQGARVPGARRRARRGGRVAESRGASSGHAPARSPNASGRKTRSGGSTGGSPGWRRARPARCPSPRSRAERVGLSLLGARAHHRGEGRRGRRALRGLLRERLQDRPRQARRDV